MKNEVTRIYNLDNVAQAREFLANLRMASDGKQMQPTEVTVEGGKVLKFAEMDDSQAVFYAKEFYRDFVEPSQRAAKKFPTALLLPSKQQG